MFRNLLKLMVPLSKYNVLKIKVIYWYFKQEYVKRVCPVSDQKRHCFQSYNQGYRKTGNN